MKMHWIYILKCYDDHPDNVDCIYYVGQTKRLYSRFWEHRRGRGGTNTYVFTPQELVCLLYTSPSPRDGLLSRMPCSA